MVRHCVVSGLPESLAPLPLSPAPPCTPCVEGRQRAAPHSSSLPPTMAPFQTLYLDVWGLSPVRGPCKERYFLIVVDDYSRYTTFLPLRWKANMPTVLKLWLLVRGNARALCGLACTWTVVLTTASGVPWPTFVPLARTSCLRVPVPASFLASHSTPPSGSSTTRLPATSSILMTSLSASRPVTTGVALTEYVARHSAVVPPAASSHSRVGGAVVEGEGTGAAGAGGVGSEGAGGVGVEFPPRSSLGSVAAEPEGVPAGGIGGTWGVGGGAAGSGVTRSGGTGSVAPTPRTVRFLTGEKRLIRLEREEREWFERARQQQQQQHEQ
ncbi:unnamed protein product [Closterium sp. NIES-53]